MNDSDIQAAVGGLSLANGLAPNNWLEAWHCASGIKLPWYRAQSLAKVAFHAPERNWLAVLRESWEAVWACDEPYKRVAVAAWPARAEIERTGQFAAKVIRALVEESRRIENTGSRVEALSTLWEALGPLSPSVRAPVQSALVREGLECRSWRGAARLRDLALTLDPEDGMAIARQMSECRVRRQIFREIGQGKRYGIRSFV